MLVELEVRDFAIIDHLRCTFEPGFNVLTGETGAGKSIVIGALGQILGERADATLVRTGAERAIVSAVFDPGEDADRLAPVLESYGLDASDELILGREIHAAGRSTARVNGRAVPAKALSELGALLVDIHGQSESASLKREASHLGLLDRYADLVPRRRAVSELVSRLREVERELSDLREDEAALARRADTLSFQVGEISAARLTESEESDLLAERTRLANAESLARLADEAFGALRDETGDRDAALDLLDKALTALEQLARIDQDLTGPHAAVATHADALSELATWLRSYRDSLAFDPARLDEVEERLVAISDLKRKYGGDVAAVNAFGERAAAELLRLRGAGERVSELEGVRAGLMGEIASAAAELSGLRQAAGARLALEVESEMGELGMAGGCFEVGISGQPDPDGVLVNGERRAFDATGVDNVGFLVSTNPGEEPRPLARVASGGETARLMLGLKTVLTAADEVPSLVFDEIDAGIGGRIGAVVGRKLWGLAKRHQVLCVTHLPQVAAYGDHHLRVSKGVVDGRAVTAIDEVTDGERRRELAAMLGADSGAVLEGATQLLDESAEWKSRSEATGVTA
ncbi:MAG: DNA repair protein RecN [Anaerolineae bacterium]